MLCMAQILLDSGIKENLKSIGFLFESTYQYINMIV